MNTIKPTFPMINRAAQQYIDRAFVEDSGLPSLILMEQAALAITESVKEHMTDRKGVVLFLVGAGNNAGDGYASARQLLNQDFPVHIVEVFPDKKLAGDAEENKISYLALGGKIKTLEEINYEELAIVIDGILGTGFSLQRPLTQEIKNLLEKVNQLTKTFRISIDIPTGIESDTGACDDVVFDAHKTITFSAPKIGIMAEPGKAFCGEVKVADISMNRQWLDETLQNFELENNIFLPRTLYQQTFQNMEIQRSPTSHKGNFGKGLLLGGSKGMQGALLLALQAALATGIGYAYVRTKSELMKDILQNYPSALVDTLPQNNQEWLELLKQNDAVAIGPGIGKANWLEQTLPMLFEQAKKLIIDADALNVLATMENWEQLGQQRTQQNLSPAVLTPHPGEFTRLAPELSELLKQDRQAAARQLAVRSQNIVILKGHATVIALPNGETYINTTGCAGLAKAGSGDVLTGLLLGFLAQYNETEKASALAVYFHGKLSEFAAEEIGIRAMTPNLLINYAKRVYMLLNWQS